jgi:hypothetical protein
MTLLPHLAARLFGVPLAIHRPKLDVILAVLGPRIGLADLATPAGFTPPARPMAPTQTSNRRDSDPRHAGAPHRGPGSRIGLDQLRGARRAVGCRAGQPDVAAILLDVDSPGGESGGVFDLADRMRVRPQHQAGLGRGQRHGLLGGLRAGIGRQQGVRHAHRRRGLDWRHCDARRPVGEGRQGRRSLHRRLRGRRKNDLNPHEPISERSPRLSQGRGESRLRPVRRHGGPQPRHRGIAGARTEAGLFFGADASASAWPMPSAPSTTRLRSSPNHCPPTPESGGKPPGLSATSRWSHHE